MNKIQIEGGAYYLNGRGDRIGPMNEDRAGVWADQYGTYYKPNGQQLNHTPDSAGNLVERVNPYTREPVRGLITCARCGAPKQFHPTKTEWSCLRCRSVE